MSDRQLSRICYVEDDEDIQRIARMALEKIGGFTVRVVSDPLTAIEEMKDFKPELVMLDWMMPGMDGPTLFRAMKEDTYTNGLPVVFITAKASQHELDELRTLGAVGTISKPFSPRELPAQLKAIWATVPPR